MRMILIQHGVRHEIREDESDDQSLDEMMDKWLALLESAGYNVDDMTDPTTVH